MQNDVYYLNVTAPTWRTDVLCGVLATGPDAVASHRTAALLHDMGGIYGRMVETTAPFDDRPEPEDVILHRTRRPIDATVVDAIPVTDPARTILDLSSIFMDRALERVAASAVRKKITTVSRLDAIIGLRGGRGVTGTRRMRRVLRNIADDVSGSIAEIDFGQLIRDAPIPSPVPNSGSLCPTGTTPTRTSPGRIECASPRSTDWRHTRHRSNSPTISTGRTSYSTWDGRSGAGLHAQCVGNHAE
jgi:hypothetical protein